MSDTSRLLIVGGANLERTSGGSWVTKLPVAEYFHELARIVGRCTWMAQVYDGPPLMTGCLNPDLIQVVPIKKGFLNEPVNWLRLVVLCRQRPYSLLFLPTIMPLLPAVPMVKLLSRRTVVYLAGDYEMNIRERTDAKWPGWSTLFRLGHEYPMRLADVVVARGQRLAHLARRFNKNVIETVPIAHMSLHKVLSPLVSETSQRHHILFVGKVLNSKGLGDLLQALQFIIQGSAETPIVLDVVGDGADRRQLEALVRDLGIEKCVRFHGWIESPDSLASFFRKADVVVVPTSSYPEGVPRVIDEALMMKVPVIATRVGGIADEFSGNEVMLVDPGNPRQLATAIQSVLFDEGVRRFYLGSMERRRSMWLHFGTAAQQHACVLLGDSNGRSIEVQEHI